MAEVTVWVEGDGVRTSITVEHDDRNKAQEIALAHANQAKHVDPAYAEDKLVFPATALRKAIREMTTRLTVQEQDNA